MSSNIAQIVNSSAASHGSLAKVHLAAAAGRSASAACLTDGRSRMQRDACARASALLGHHSFGSGSRWLSGYLSFNSQAFSEHFRPVWGDWNCTACGLFCTNLDVSKL